MDLLAVVVVLAGCGGSSAPHFQAANGWHLLTSAGSLAAANVGFAAGDRASHPDRTVARLPRDGIVIWAMTSHSPRWPPGATPLPLRLGEALPSNPFEGFRCAPAVPLSRCYAASGSVRRLGAQVGRYHVDLYVFFGTDRPAASSVASANLELARLRFPGAPRARTPACPARWGDGAYDTTLSRSSGPPGATVTVSGALGVIEEDGTYGGQTATRVDAYWNLDFRRWWTVTSRRPLPAVAGSPVRHLGQQDVARRCRYRFRVTIPSVPRGTYPIEVLSGDSHGGASFAPVDFVVTGG